jgi:hypothetical protein
MKHKIVDCLPREQNTIFKTSVIFESRTLNILELNPKRKNLLTGSKRGKGFKVDT